jgi:malonyl-CoA/methylmalonyl-CoA synthetase
MSATERLFARVDAGGDELAFEERASGARLSWSELRDASRRYASALRAAGVHAGDRVATFAGTSLDLIVALLGHYRVGAVHVPINTRYRGEELTHVLEDSGAKLVVADAAGLEILRDLPAAASGILAGIDDADAAALDLRRLALADQSPFVGDLPSEDALALMIYTSGTTGKSKGVCLEFRAVVGGIGALTTLWQWSEADRQHLALPLFHVHGLGIGVHGALLHGVSTRLASRFDAAAVVEDFGPEFEATIFMGVPTMHGRLLRYLEEDPARADALRRGRLFTSGSAALPARDFERFERLTGHRILERYGMSETLLSLSNPYEGERRPGAVGFPVPGYEARVVDEKGAEVARGEVGELWVRGPGLLREYWGRPDATAAAFEDGWFKTGDVVKQSEDGYLSIVGRRSVDIIKSGGFKISAREIEEALLEDEAIEEVAVLGIPDEEWGERIVAAVVLNERAPRLDEPAWVSRAQACLSGRIADYKRPRSVRVVVEIPRNALGKVQKHRLRSLWTKAD